MNSNEQNNTMLYVTILVGLVIIGAVRGATLGFLEDGGINVNNIIAEVIGGALTFGLLVFVVQQLSNATQRLGDIVGQQKEDIEKLRAVQDKIMNEGAMSRTASGRSNKQSFSSPEPTPDPVVESPPPAPTPESSTPASEPAPTPAPESNVTDSRPSSKGLSAKDLLKQKDRFTSAPTPLPNEPDSVPAPSPKDTLETQIAQELDAFGFDEMFEDYQQERDEAIASGKGFFDEEDEGFPE